MTHLLIMIDPCAKCGKPMSNQNIVMVLTQINTNRWTERWEDRWTDIQTDGQTDILTDRVIPIYPPELRSRGGIINQQWQRKAASLSLNTTAVNVLNIDTHYQNYT